MSGTDIDQLASGFAYMIAGAESREGPKATDESKFKWDYIYTEVLKKIYGMSANPEQPVDTQWKQFQNTMEGLGVTQLSDTGLTDRITKIDEEIRTLNNVLGQSLFEGKPGIDTVATINHIKQLQNSRDELARFSETVRGAREEMARRVRGGLSDSKTTIKDELVNAFKNPPVWDMFLPGLSNAANAASQVLGVVANKITGIPEESKVKGGIPATETIMAQSKEEADMIKRIWQEQHLPADKGKEQEESAVRKKLLEVLPQINNWLQQIASAEGI